MSADVLGENSRQLDQRRQRNVFRRLSFTHLMSALCSVNKTVVTSTVSDSAVKYKLSHFRPFRLIFCF